MRYLYLALFAFTLWQRGLCDFADRVRFLMAWITEMCIAPAKPDGHAAAKLAFKFYIVCSVNFAFSYATPHIDRVAHGTEKLFFALIIYV